MRFSLLGFPLLLLLFLSDSVKAEGKDAVVCQNKEDTVAYALFTLDSDQSYTVPKGSIAYIDVMMQTLDGPPLVSGIVTRGDKRLTDSDGSDRWFFILAEWDCTYQAPAPKQEV